MSGAISARVLKAMGVFGGVQVMGVLCSIVRTKLVALWLGPAGIGLFGIYNLAADMLRTLSQLGFRDSSVRDVVANRTDAARLASIICVVRRWGVILGSLGVLVMLVASPVLSLKTFGSYSNTLGFALLGLVLFFGALTAAEQVLLQGLGHLRELAKASMWGMLGGLAVSAPMYYFWRMESILPSIIAYAVTTWGAMYFYRVRGTGTNVALSLRETFRQGRHFIVLGIFMTSADFISQLISYIFVAWLNIGEGDTVVGFYQAGYTMINRYIGLVLAAVVMEYYPRLASALASALRLRVYVAHEALLLMLILLPAALFFISFAPWIVSLLYAGEFTVVTPYVTIAMIGVIFRALSYCMAYVILAKGDGVIYLVTESLSAALSLVLNIVAFRLWGIAGLGVSYALWYLGYLVIIAIVYFRRYGLSVPAPTVRFALLSVVLVTAGVVIALAVSPLVVLPVAVITAIVCLRRLLKLGRFRRRQVTTV